MVSQPRRVHGPAFGSVSFSPPAPGYYGVAGMPVVSVSGSLLGRGPPQFRPPMRTAQVLAPRQSSMPTRIVERRVGAPNTVDNTRVSNGNAEPRNSGPVALDKIDYVAASDELSRQIAELEAAKNQAAAQQAMSKQQISRRNQQLRRDADSAVQRARELQGDLVNYRPALPGPDESVQLDTSLVMPRAQRQLSAEGGSATSYQMRQIGEDQARPWDTGPGRSQGLGRDNPEAGDRPGVDRGGPQRASSWQGPAPQAMLGANPPAFRNTNDTVAPPTSQPQQYREPRDDSQPAGDRKVGGWPRPAPWQDGAPQAEPQPRMSTSQSAEVAIYPGYKDRDRSTASLPDQRGQERRSASQQRSRDQRGSAARLSDSIASRTGMSGQQNGSVARDSSYGTGTGEAVARDADSCLEAMRWAIDEITPESLFQIGKLKAPPKVVHLVLATTCVLLGYDDASWSGICRALADPAAFRQRLFEFEPMGVNVAQHRRLRKSLLNPDFEQEYVRSVFQQVYPMAVFCRACGAYLSESRSEAGRRDVEAIVDRGDSYLSFSPDLRKMSPAALQSVQDLQVTRLDVGSIHFHGWTDCRGLDFDSIITLEVGEVLVYPDPKTKPPPGEGLNKPATVTMFQCWPPNGSDCLKDRRAQEKYRRKIQQMTEKKNAYFLDYDCLSGIWKFQVEHF
mmetsp:Transcript_43582/g.98032  ORF Transcript_43582/g.98032 Transcript_43582/m.98032 type:complete len:677 (-) Transcript_43582:159-2189(-)